MDNDLTHWWLRHRKPPEVSACSQLAELKAGVLLVGYVIKDLLLAQKYPKYIDNYILCVKIVKIFQEFHFYFVV